MTYTSDIKSIREVLNPVFGRYLLVTSGVCSILLPLSVLRYVDTGWLPIYTLHIGLYCTLLLFAFVPRLAQFRLIFSITLFMLLGLSGVLQFGFSAGGEIPLVAAMVITTIGFGYSGLAISVFITVIMLLTPHIAVILEPIISTGFKPYLLPHTDWTLATLSLLFFGVSVSYLAQRLVIAIQSKSQQLAFQNAEKDQQADELIIVNKQLYMSVADNQRIAADLMLLVNTANAPIFGIDAQGKINEWNLRSQTITGFTKKEVLGRDLVADFITDDYKVSVSVVLEKALKGQETANYEFPLFSKSGERVDVLLNSATRRDASGQIVGVIGVGQDITELNEVRAEQETERKEAAAQIIHASKLATLGEMSTSVAHELNQPLNVIRMASGNSRRRISKGTADFEYLNDKLERIEEQTKRAAVIIDHMRMFGGKAKEESEIIDSRKVVTNALNLMGEQLRLSGIEVVTELPEYCPSILGHAIQMEQVLLNLLNNARDAITEREGEAKITLRVFEDERGVHITAEDTGGGIPEDALPRIFEPFYTTKEMGKGTGLGLSVSYGIVLDMNGTIVADNIGDGARFTITLPSVS